MTLRDACLPIFEGARVLLAKAGLRRHDVTMRVVTWTGGTVGEGTRSVVDTPLLVQDQRVKVRRVSQKDVVASGGCLSIRSTPTKRRTAMLSTMASSMPSSDRPRQFWHRYMRSISSSPTGGRPRSPR